ncbi:DUF1566 domain-containing protein [Marinimicrobium sp. ABcell2]|uniref:Lcl C-terminal domain-containing protein n=1 Tax=Marinimicrobium sp. ABcell2 TaxID=3069751 RepID=UPI0027B7877C|nr:DUF1566 domain-containing protein [Marinimicrobium sp. ABcell2]MDQ2075634.1 DUF1566 domain-containing protein [Marinimicrobium sp. ABcell2]
MRLFQSELHFSRALVVLSILLAAMLLTGCGGSRGGTPFEPGTPTHQPPVNDGGSQQDDDQNNGDDSSDGGDTGGEGSGGDEDQNGNDGDPSSGGDQDSDDGSGDQGGDSGTGDDDQSGDDDSGTGSEDQGGDDDSGTGGDDQGGDDDSGTGDDDQNGDDSGTGDDQDNDDNSGNDSDDAGSDDENSDDESNDDDPAPVSYSVTVNTDEGGSVDPGSLDVAEGESASFTIAPDPGFEIGPVTGCGGSLDGSVYLISEVTEACQIDVTFTPLSFTVTASAEEGGSISPGSVQVNYGATADFTVEVDAGFLLLDVEGCGGTWNETPNYITGEVTGDCEVQASIKDLRHTVTATAEQGGTFHPTSKRVPPGETTTFTLEVRTGYTFEGVHGCGAVIDGDTVTTGPVDEACEITASFSTLTVAAPLNLMATSGDSQLSLMWDGVENANGYMVYYATEPGVVPGGTGGDVVETAEPGATLTGLTNGTSYYVVVTAIIDDQVESDPSNEAVALVHEDIQGYSYWPTDTGIWWCADNDESDLLCPVEDFPGQDGDYPGSGFSFTKLDANGNPLDDSATEWRCVEDNNTGLVWEVKLDDSSSLHHYSHRYSWYQPDGQNGGHSGTQDAGNCKAGTDCDTHAFVAAVNEATLCGAADWRLPTRQELLTLVDSGTTSPATDSTYFPRVQYSGTHVYYWTATSVAADGERAYQIHFDLGYMESSTKNYADHVRLVRGTGQ